jgi:hypothetical protein
MGKGKGKGKVLLNRPQREKISPMELLAVAEVNVRGRLRYRRLTRTGIFRAGSSARTVKFLR